MSVNTVKKTSMLCLYTHSLVYQTSQVCTLVCEGSDIITGITNLLVADDIFFIKYASSWHHDHGQQSIISQ